jgi:hypothetical protein
MPALANHRHEMFCQLYVILGNASEAYRRAGFTSKNADVTGHRALVKASNCKRIAEIKAELEAKSRNFTVHDGVEWLLKLIDIPVALGEVKPSDQLRAFELLTKLLGLNAAEKLELGMSNKLTQYLSDLRSEREVKAIEIGNERQLDEPPLP